MAAQDAGQAPKGKTAYFVFCELHRASVREELLAGKEEGAKVCCLSSCWSNCAQHSAVRC